ncbi:MAG: DUF192 domain-containing protein [Candidatus Micrarchaeia archaeon]
MGLMHFLQRRQVYREVVVRIGSYALKAELSDTFVKRMIGLMYRDGLEKDHCMLFDFHREEKYGIWMHNMRFPIDVLWVGSNMQIVDMLAFAKRCGNIVRCKTYKPSEPARYVIELPSGYITEKGIAAGMRISIEGIEENK